MLTDGYGAMWDIATLGWPLLLTVYNRTEIQRNIFAMQLLSNPSLTHLLMLDTDHVHPPREDIMRLCRHAVADPDKYVISGLYYRRGPPYESLAHFYEGKDLFTMRDWPDELQKVAVVGAGIMLVAREAFERIPLLWFKYDYSRGEELHFPSEDNYFCAQCLKYGIDIWVDPTVKSGHLKTEIVDKAYSERYADEHEGDRDAFDLFPQPQYMDMSGGVLV